MKKIVSINKKIIPRKKEYDLSFNDTNYINRLYLDEDFDKKNTIIKELKKKLSSYLAQDKKKNRPYDKKKYINYPMIIIFII